MKKYIKSIVLSGLLISAASCTDKLTETPDSFYEKDKFFTTVQKAEMAVIGAYDPLSKLEHYGQFEMAMPTSDDMYYINGTNNDNSRRDISHYMLSTTNQWVERLWMHKYSGIERANYALEGIRGMDLYKEGNATLKKLEGELCFLRAFYAFDLVKYWGDVPFRTTSVSSAGSGDLGYIGRVDREEIYDQIMKDLDSAIELIPDAPATSKAGNERASKAAAATLKMRALMQRAGFALKSDGTLSAPDEAKRAAYFQDVVDLFNKVNGALVNSYPQLWIDLSSERQFNPTENLFEIAFFNQSGVNEDSGNWGTYIGPIVNASSTYGRANAFFRVLPEWLNYYEATDERRDVNICQYEIMADDSQKFDKKGGKWTPGKWRREWMPKPKDQNNTDVNFIALRYSDAILLAAEAYNELGQSDKAIELINQVRTRAKATPVQADLSNYAEFFKAPKVIDLPYIDDADVKGKIRTILYWERGFELCYEGTRKYDLIRWGVLDNAIKLFGQTKLNTATSKPYMAIEKFETGKHELFPIPLAEMQLNGMLNVQNPGY